MGQNKSIPITSKAKNEKEERTNEFIRKAETMKIEMIKNIEELKTIAWKSDWENEVGAFLSEVKPILCYGKERNLVHIFATPDIVISLRLYPFGECGTVQMPCGGRGGCFHKGKLFVDPHYVKGYSTIFPKGTVPHNIYLGIINKIASSYTSFLDCTNYPSYNYYQLKEYQKHPAIKSLLVDPTVDLSSLEKNNNWVALKYDTSAPIFRDHYLENELNSRIATHLTLDGLDRLISKEERQELDFEKWKVFLLHNRKKIVDFDFKGSICLSSWAGEYVRGLDDFRLKQTPQEIFMRGYPTETIFFYLWWLFVTITEFLLFVKQQPRGEEKKIDENSLSLWRRKEHVDKTREIVNRLFYKNLTEIVFSYFDSSTKPEDHELSRIFSTIEK